MREYRRSWLRHDLVAGLVLVTMLRNATQGCIRWLPGAATLREYRRSWLRHDLVAGLVLVTMLVPVGIAMQWLRACPVFMGSTP